MVRIQDLSLQRQTCYISGLITSYSCLIERAGESVAILVKPFGFNIIFRHSQAAQPVETAADGLSPAICF
ncbi:hypothetical protein K439DRAFT_1626709 [Ramaria rubella]|nr:hypothetical protein K439DRAFT_1626709 [Ramaria rubella]